jgi:TonB-dependent siderophore receptor
MHVRRLYALLFVLICSFSFFPAVANEVTGEIKGKVLSLDGLPVAGVTIEIRSLKRSAVTDDQGNFHFKKLAADDYTLSVSFIGYASVEKQVQVAANAISDLEIQLSLSYTQLDEIVVSASKNKFAHKESNEVARLPLKNLENPQVYTVVGEKLFNEQVATERTDIYRNVPGAVPNFAAGGSQGMSLRGFSNQMGMRNGLITSAVVPLNIAILEKVEVLKGPSSTLFGSNRNTTFGGVFNYITKQPYDHFGGEISLTTGSFRFSRLAADINTELNKAKTALFRINIAGQTERSFQDQGYAKNYTIAPSFSYQFNERLKLLVDAEITQSAYTTTALAFGNLNTITTRSFKDLPFGYKQSFINNSVDIHNGIYNLQARLEYKISDQWKSQTNYLFSEGFYKSLLWTTHTLLTDSTIARSVRNQTPETFGNIQLQQNFTGDFEIGGLRNRLVVGLDYSQNYNELYRVTVNYDTINFRKPVADINADKIRTLSGAKGFSGSTFSSHSYSLYVSDVLNITPQLMAMLSLRADRYTTDGNFTPATRLYTGNYAQNSLSPKFGIVYQPVADQVSVFANYMNGFVNLAPVSQPDKTILELKPQFGNQLEAGVKLDLFKHKLNATLSYYDIAVTNSTRSEVINGGSFTVQDGTQNSRGFEAEIIASPSRGLNLVAGYVFNENKYDKASKALEGKFLTFSPQHVGNVWISYRIPSGNMEGLGLGAGGNYVSDSWFESTNSIQLPAYTLINATIFYETGKYRFAVKGNNLGNQQYWNNNGTAQKPGNFLATVSVAL